MNYLMNYLKIGENIQISVMILYWLALSVPILTVKKLGREI